MSAPAPFLTAQQRAELIARHKRERNARYANRLLVILWRDEGVTFDEIARRLFLDPKTPSDWENTYRTQGLAKLLADDYIPYPGKLAAEQGRQLADYVDSRIFLDVTPIILYAEEHFGVTFTPSGMRDLLHRLGFTYKKASLVPGKADAEKQRRFVTGLQELLRVKNADTPVLFMDATHPTYNARPSYGWIRKGARVEVSSTPGRQRVNLNGAVNAETHETFVVEAARIDAAATIALLQQIEAHYPSAPWVYLFTDNAPYYRSRAVSEYLALSRIPALRPDDIVVMDNLSAHRMASVKRHLEEAGFSVLYLPPYSPDLNPIEPMWSQVKSSLRRLAARTFDTLCEAMKQALEWVKPSHCHGYFQECGCNVN